VRHQLLVVALVLCVLFCAVPVVEKWWQRSCSAYWLRCRLIGVRATVAYLFRLLRKRPTKPTAGAGVSPTPAPAVPHPHRDVEVSCGRHQ
jgi:hypothetical protein